MRLFTFLAILTVLVAPAASGQSFTVNAGPDKGWCSDLQGIPADTPILGGTSIVTGGVAPLSFDWSLLYTDVRGIVMTPPPSLYLDNYQAPYPKMLQKAPADSMRAVLTVRDATGAAARDTTWIYFQTIACTTGNDPVIIKHPSDTVTLVISGGGVCISKFRPSIEYRWRPADYLVDSTVQLARCYTPISKRYTVFAKDRIGCPVRNSVDVAIEPVNVTNTGDEHAFLRFDIATRTLAAQLTGTGRMQLVDMSGKTVWEEVISGNGKAVVPASLPAGLYLGTLRDAKGQVIIRQKLTL